MYVRERLCVCVVLQLGAASRVGGLFHDGKYLDRATSLNRKNERIAQHAAS